MKYLITLILYLSAVNISYAQKIRFTDTSNLWYYAFSHTTSHGVFKTEYKGDTMYKGVHYLVLGGRLVREDTINKQIFIIDDTTEMLLYDFTLEVGDTFYYNAKFNSGKHVVEKIDSVRIDSNWYRVRHYKAVTGGFPYAVIDNIGCTGGLLFPFWTYSTVEYFERLHCFFNAGSKPVLDTSVSTPYGFPFTNTDSCYVSVAELSKQNSNITISPHPASSGSIMTLPYLVKEATYTLYNPLGQIVEYRTVTHTDKLKLEQHNTGVYYYIVSDKVNGKSFRGKIMFE